MARLESVFMQEFGGDGTNSPSTITWSVQQARDFVAARPRKPVKLSREHIAEQLLRREYTPGHEAHIPHNLLDEPGLAFYFSTLEGPEQVETRQLFLLDGAHRA